MTQDEVLNLARQADGQVTMWVNHSTIQKTTTLTFESPIDYYVSGEYPEMYHIKFLEAFAKLVAAKEREAILPLLKGIDETEIESADGWWETSTGAAIGAKILSTIRARGQA